MLGGDAHAVAADGSGNSGNGLVLSHNVLLQPILQLVEAAELGFFNLTGGDFRPHLDDAGDVVHSQLGGAESAEVVQLCLGAHFTGAKLGDAGIAGVQLLLCVLLAVGGGSGHQGLTLEGEILHLTLQLHAAVDGLVVEVAVGTGLVNEVDGLIGEETVGNIPLGQQYRLPQDAIGDGHTVELLIVVGDAAQNLQRVVHVGLVDGDGLEAALESRVLLNMLAVFVEGGSADDLNLAAREGGLQDIGGVHAALGVACAHDVVDFVNDEDDVARLANLLNETLHAAFKLTAELGACHEGGQVEKIDLLITELEGHFALDDALGKTLGDGGFTHAWLTDEAGVILLTAIENLHHPLDFLFAAYNGVQLALAGTLGEVDAVIIEELALGLFLAARCAVVAVIVGLGSFGGHIAAALTEETVQEGEGGGLAALLLVLVLHVGQLFRAAEGLHHLVGDALQILGGDAHALHHLLHLGKAERGGALKAQTLILGLARLFIHAGDEHHRNIFLTSGTKGRLHSLYPPMVIEEAPVSSRAYWRRKSCRDMYHWGR